jgi:hypothetical protein
MIQNTKIDCNSYEAKYLIFSSVIDMLAHKCVEKEVDTGKTHTMTFNEIRDSLLKDENIAEVIQPYTDTQINQWISELSWMGMIVRVSDRTNNSEISLTAEGYEAYKAQTLHGISANLREARESRRLSKNAIIIAIISICITAIFAIIDIILKLTLPVQ